LTPLPMANTFTCSLLIYGINFNKGEPSETPRKLVQA
jgi:hypothetical protein